MYRIRKFLSDLSHYVSVRIEIHRLSPRRIGDKVERARLTHSDEHGRLNLLRGLGNLAAVGFGYSEMITVQVARMMLHHRDTRDADTHAIAQLCYHRFRGRENFRVKSEDVEISHLVGIRP